MVERVVFGACGVSPQKAIHAAQQGDVVALRGLFVGWLLAYAGYIYVRFRGSVVGWFSAFPIV